MAGLCFGDVAARPTELLDLTSLTREEFAAVVGPFEAAFTAHMTLWRFDGQPRRTRRYTTYANCPLPTAEDRLFFLLVYLKTYPLQVVQGQLFGLPQGKTNQWIHVLLPVLREALRQLGDAPSRSLEELAQRLAVPAAALAPVLAAGQTAETPETPQAPQATLLCWLVRSSARSEAPRPPHRGPVSRGSVHRFQPRMIEPASTGTESGSRVS